VEDTDIIILVILLLRAGAKKWYDILNVYINEDAAIRDKRPFHTNNVLRT